MIYTVYAPANHIDVRIHKTKAGADADTEDESFGKTLLLDLSRTRTQSGEYKSIF